MSLYAHACGQCSHLYAVPSGEPLVLLACPHCGQAPIHPDGVWVYGQETDSLPQAVERDA